MNCFLAKHLAEGRAACQRALRLDRCARWGLKYGKPRLVSSDVVVKKWSKPTAGEVDSSKPTSSVKSGRSKQRIGT